MLIKLICHRDYNFYVGISYPFHFCWEYNVDKNENNKLFEL